jgi:putative acetyltransferase
MIQTRPYEPQDRAACKAVYYRAVREGAAAVYTPAQRAAWAASPEVDPTTPDKLLDQWCHVSVEGGAITGFMSLCPDGYLDMAFVLPEVMGKGHSAALYEGLIAHARGLGLSRLTVHASHLARRFFGRRGWQVDMAEVVEIGDQKLTRFAMSLDLAAVTAGSPIVADGPPPHP